MIMKGYKKYRTIHRISYISLFSYLFIVSVSNFNFGGYADYIPYFIAIPFFIYCGIAIGMEILIRRDIRKEKPIKNEYGYDKKTDYDNATTVLSNI